MTKVFVVTVKYDHPITSKLSDLIIVDNTKNNRGFTAGANLGIKKALAKGAEAVLLLNPDAKITSAQVSTLAATSGDIVAPVLTFTRRGKKSLDYGGVVNLILGRPWHRENAPGLVDYVSGACMLIRRPVFAKIGLLDEKFFLYFEDADFCLRAKQAGFSVTVAKKVIVKHQISEHRDSRDRFKMDQGLKSNWVFLNKWVPWYFRPVAMVYWLLLWLKTR